MLSTNESGQVSPRPRKHRLVPDATYRGRGRNGEAGKPSGAGFKLHGVWCSLMLPLVIELTAISVHDKTGGVTIVLPELERLFAQLGRKLRVIVGDAAYWGVDFITGVMRLGSVPCVHESSHKKAKKTEREVENKNKTFTPIEDPHHPATPEDQTIRFTKWWANGHLEFFCECGQGRTEIDISLGRKGQALIRTDLSCENCGDLTITAGLWRLIQGPKRFKREWKDVPEDAQRPSFGNPLTYHSPQAAEYGPDRFGYGESPHGQLQRGYNLGGRGNPAPIRSKAHAEYIAYSIAGFMWANAIKRMKAAAAFPQAA